MEKGRPASSRSRRPARPGPRTPATGDAPAAPPGRAPQAAEPRRAPRPGKPDAGDPPRAARAARSGKPDAASGDPPRAARAARPGKPDAASGDPRRRPKPGGKGPAPRARRPGAKPPPPQPPPPERSRARPKRDAAPKGPPRSGRVALIGRPNVGKSTLLNAALGHPLTIVSPIPQTTRDAILGVVHHGAAEVALLDTPGLHRPRTELGRAMNEAAREAARSADVVVLVVEAAPPRKPPRAGDDDDAPALAPHPGDVTLLADLGAAPVVLVVNKVDQVRDKKRLLPFLEAFSKLHPFAAIVPISALRDNGVERVLDEVARLCPERPWEYPPDELTDRPTRFFAAEYVREQILRATEAEVPHACAVEIERFVEPAGGGTVHIDATIHVERSGQKKILIGTGADMLKRIGTQARLRIEELIGRQVNLKLWVRVTPDWRESLQQLEQLGYAAKRVES